MYVMVTGPFSYLMITSGSIDPRGIFGDVQHPTGLALGVVNCSFNSGSLAPDPAQPGFGLESLEGMYSLEVMHALLGEWHVTSHHKNKYR